MVKTICTTKSKQPNGFTGKHHTKEAKLRISSAHRGKKFTEEHKKHISDVKKGKPAWNKGIPFSKETRYKMSLAKKGKQKGTDNPFYGKHHTKETKSKISNANKDKHDGGRLKGCLPWNKGKKMPEEFCKKNSMAHRGRTASKETKQKMSESRKNKPKSDEWKKKISISNKGKRRTEKTKEKISKSLKGLLKGIPKSDEWKRKISGKNHHNWIDGRSFLPYCHKFNNNLKENTRVRDQHTCQLCGVKENSKKHSIHHIHYDKTNCYPDLITLCCSCNTKVNKNRPFYESFFMNNLNTRGLLFWTKNFLE